MITRRTDCDGYTTIMIRNEDAPSWNAHVVTCMDVDIDKDGRPQPPTAGISALTLGAGASVSDLRRLAAEYAYVADLAEQLQAEKRAAYNRRVSSEPA